MPTLEKLRQKHPKFIYENYSWEVVSDDSLEITFHYIIDPDIPQGTLSGSAIHLVSFSPTLIIKNVSQKMVNSLGKEKLDSYIFNIGLSEMFSYWKCTASPIIEIKAGKLDKKQISWWHKLLIKGMGEYFFVNDIKFTDTDFVKIENNSEKSHQAFGSDLTNNHDQNSNDRSETAQPVGKILVPIGGGKDSAVTLEILSNLPTRIGTFAVSPTQAALDTISAKTDIINHKVEVQRTIDPKLIELNNQGYLNGHVPISAFFAFVSVFCAELFGYSHVAISNERSSNEGNVQFCNREINHQYSKTYEFEKDFQNYTKKYLPAGAPLYFSFLRPLYELQIAKIFAKMEKYHSIFRSCNRGQKTNSWCGECSKCLFAYTIIFPFLSDVKIQTHFGKDLFSDEKLWPIAEELLGVGEKKPLECVGTHEETIVAFYLSIKKYLDNNKKLPALLKKVNKNIIENENNLYKRSETILNSWNEENSLPIELVDLVKNKANTNHEKANIDLLEKLKTCTVVILGLGREGLSTYQFLRTNFPNKKLFLIDEKTVSELGDKWSEVSENDKNAEFTTSFENIKESLQLIDNLDRILMVKSPGIPPSSPLVLQAKNLELKSKKLEVKITSNTNLFLRLLKSPDPKLANIETIGVTGTKGKSTTASMIHHVLKNCGVKSFLGGNIGIPPLSLWGKVESYLDEKGISASENIATNQPIAVVLEMSSHQLSDAMLSPNIAVILDISPEHLDYYESFEEYVKAKSQIVRFQTENDTVIFNDKQKLPTEMASRGKGKQVTFNFEENVLELESNLNKPAIYYKNEKIIDVDQLPVLGKHNILNSIPSIIIAKKFGCKTEDIGHSLKTFKTLPHRLEMVKNTGGITYVNDSLSTTPKSTIAAIKSFNSSPIILIAGGYDRNLEFTELAEVISSSNVKHLVLLPDTGEKILKEVENFLKNTDSSLDSTTQTTHTFAKNMEEAVEIAKSIAKSGDVVLLSPAAASFGHFKDYQDRGEQFRRFTCK